MLIAISTKFKLFSLLTEIFFPFNIFPGNSSNCLEYVLSVISEWKKFLIKDKKKKYDWREEEKYDWRLGTNMKPLNPKSSSY